MTYKDYPEHKGCYVVVHYTGYGVMEAPHIEQEAVFSTNDHRRAKIEAHEFMCKNNSSDSIASTWTNNNYHININTATKKGKELHEKFSAEFDKLLANTKKHPDTKEVKMGNNTMYFIPMKEFDEPK